MPGFLPRRGPQDAGVGGRGVPAYQDAEDAVLSARPLSTSDGGNCGPHRGGAVDGWGRGRERDAGGAGCDGDGQAGGGRYGAQLGGARGRTSPPRYGGGCRGGRARGGREREGLHAMSHRRRRWRGRLSAG